MNIRPLPANFSHFTALVVYVVSQSEGVVAFHSRRKAEKYLVAEAWDGADDLTITAAYAPSHLTGDDLSEWCARNVLAKGAPR